MSDEDKEIEFFFDVASPYSYLASTQLDELAQSTGAFVRWKPFLLGGVFKATGNSPPAGVENKRSYMLADLHRWADYYGVSFEMPSIFPVNSLLAQRAIAAVKNSEHSAAPDFASELFADYWVEDRDISKETVVSDAAERLGLPGERITERANTPEVKEKLQSFSDEAVERGAFGAPTFFVGDEMFWGNDRLMFVEQAVK